jgi:hypothetical protein
MTTVDAVLTRSLVRPRVSAVRCAQQCASAGGGTPVKQRQLAFVALLFLIGAGQPCVCEAESEEPLDEITVKGQRLRGTVISLGSETIEFETIYGSGTLRIPLEHIEDIDTAVPMRVYFGESDETVAGRLVGVHDGLLVVGEDPTTQVSVDLAEIRYGIAQPRYEESFWRRLRSDFREWNVEFDLSLDFEQGALDKSKARISAEVARRRDPFRLRMQAAYAIDVQQLRDEPEQTTKDEFSGSILGEYDLWRKLAVFGLMGGEFDIPRRVEARIFPTVGLGYRIFDSERATLQPKLGFGYVYEDFTDEGSNANTNSYASGFIGLDGSYRWEMGAELRGRFGYWPGLTSPGKNWLFRSELTATVPIWDPLAFRATLININDNNPSPDTGNNKFQTIMGLALDF